MAEHDDSAEKTEEPTGKRLEDARKKGQVLRSRELGTLVSLLGCGLALLLLGPSLIAACERMLGAAFVLDASVLRDASVLPQRLRQAGIDMLVAGLPLLGCVVALALLGPALLGGWICNGELLQPKLERLDPLRGLGRLFSLKSLVELVKALAKFGVVAALAIAVLALVLPDIVKLSLLEARVALERSGRLFLLCYLGFSAALILVVLFDVPYQIHDYRRQLRMTKQELKDELKESEGRPEVKAALRARQQEAASRRMMAQVPKADVVITNPTHYAVALRYEQGGARAPTLIAKG
ncbi:MAG TPA: EscU/YscU/HrcU family type III secretion system export apparatus switch protein, partial [Hyphomicrobiales bacterium]|nr:EscU/YscU/HrcU family type III secretion system export apparatus switch protein [Hyphomicrobiales bacterium]